MIQRLHLLLCRGSGLRRELRHRPGVATRWQDLHVRHRAAGRDGVEDQPGVRHLAASWPIVTTETPGSGIMTPTQMDQLTTPTHSAELAADDLTPDTFSPPPATRQRRAPSAWVPMFQMRERRWWTIALAATLLVSAFGIGLLYVDDTTNQATVRSLTTENEQQSGRIQILQDQLSTTEQNLTASLGELARTKSELEHPTLVIWTLPQQI